MSLRLNYSNTSLIIVPAQLRLLLPALLLQTHSRTPIESRFLRGKNSFEVVVLLLRSERVFDSRSLSEETRVRDQEEGTVLKLLSALQ